MCGRISRWKMGSKGKARRVRYREQTRGKGGGCEGTEGEKICKWKEEGGEGKVRRANTWTGEGVISQPAATQVSLQPRGKR